MNTLQKCAYKGIGALIVLTAALPARAESFAINKPKTADRIDFQVDLQPADPFSDANKVGAPRDFSRGEVIRLIIQGAPHQGYHTYPITKQYKGEESYLTRLILAGNDAVRPLWPVAETPPESVLDKDLWEFILEHPGPFTWIQEFYIKPDAKPGPQHLRFTIDLTVCDATDCQPGKAEYEVPFTIIDSPVTAATPDLQERLKVTQAPPVEWVNPPPAPPRPVSPKVGATHAAGFWDLLGFMLQGIAAGAVSLLTPCVFPMIPITVSFFLKHSDKSHAAGPRRAHSPVLMAAIYSGTIAAVLTLAGVLLLQFVQQFSQHWATNFVLGALFVFFALSLFGMYDIVLPSSLGRLTAAGEGRGGLVGVVFMALTFTVISFACVAPFYGGFIALSGTGATAADQLKLVLGALAFSVTFALPFFVLALFPSLLKALPKSGSWLNTVKVVMGFLELAAALKFLRSAELNFGRGHTEYLTYDLVLGAYIALSLACGLYLLGVYRLPHDHGVSESLSVPRLLFSVAFLGLALYLTPALFKTADGEPQRPRGAMFAWVDAFLLREDQGPGASGPGRLAWVGDLPEALKQAQAEKKLVFLDFTATTCTNCKYNEGAVFTQPKIKDLLGKYVLVHLYTDNVPPEYHSSMSGAEYHELQQAQFKDDTLPLYAIVRPTGAGKFEALGKPYEGKINDPGLFAQFLQSPLSAAPSDARAEVR